MKFKTLLFSIFIALLFSCGSNTDNQETEEGKLEEVSNAPNTPSSELSPTIEQTEEDYSKPRYISSGKNKLVIHGKDIWVRDEPATGKVVMKLNEGDRCVVLEEGFMEMIRGDADYWYKIEFNGQQGWVFGAQTSYKNAQAPITANSEANLWEAFKEYYKFWTEKENEIFMKNYGSLDEQKLIFVSSIDEFSWVKEHSDGIMSGSFTKNPNTHRNLMFFTESFKISGAYGFPNTWLTHLAIQQSDDYILYPNFTINGKVEKVFGINSQEIVLITYQDSGDEVAAFKNTSYNAYYVDLKKQSVRKSNFEIGKFESDMDTYGYAEIGDILDIKVELVYDEQRNSFSSQKFRVKKTKEINTIKDLIPYDTLATQFLWDNKTKSYQKDQ